MSDDDYTIKLDANIEVETVVRNIFEEYEDLCYNDPFSNHFSVSSDDDHTEANMASSSTSAEYRDSDNVASVGSDASETYTSAVSDVSAESTDSNTFSEQASRSKGDGDAHYMESPVKNVNCKELIVFCIDMSSDMEDVPYIVTDEFDEREEKYYMKDISQPGPSSEPQYSRRVIKETKHSPLSMVKRAISMFVHNKNFVNEAHEYSIMVLYETATWVCEFTNSPLQLVDALEDLTETVECDYCDLASVIILLIEKYPFLLSNEFLAPDVHRVFRVILIYGRANSGVTFSDRNAKEILIDNPSLFMDIVYIHEPPSDLNRCKEIFESLSKIDEREKSYIFETTRSVTGLYNAMGRLLSHPFQRVPQKDSNYRLQDYVPPKKKRV